MATEERIENERREPDDVINRVETFVVNRREFLVGALAGGVGIGGTVGANAFTEGARLERLATLASGTAVPRQTTYHIPASSSENRGLVVGFTVKLTDGTGGIYVNLDAVEVRHDIQLALREATVTATTVAGASLDELDVFASFIPPDDEPLVLRGKSWEAGFTITLIGALTARQPSRRVLVTGVVGADGELLPVGGIEAKAIAARRFGAERLLVPPDQAVSIPGIDVTAVEDISEVASHVFE